MLKPITQTPFYLFTVCLLAVTCLAARAQDEEMPIEISEDDLLEELLVSEDDLIVEELDAPAPVVKPPADIKDEAIFLEENGDGADWSTDVGDMDLIEDLEAPAQKGDPMSKVPGGGIDVASFEELLKENIEIRKSADAFAEQARELQGEVAGLKNLIKDNETQLADSVRMIQTLKQEKAAAVARADKAAAGAPVTAGAPATGGGDAALQAELRKAMDSVSTMTAEIAMLKADNKRMTETLSKPMAPPAGNASAPQAGSDLFKALEQESFDLKEQIKTFEASEDALNGQVATLIAEKAELQTFQDTATQREDLLRAEVAEAVRGQEEYKATIAKLLEHVPGMEEEVAELKNAVDVKDMTLQARDRELITLRQELERRELRIIKAERMAELLEKTRHEVREAGEKEKRDMHFNMAVVYMKEGNFRGAEKEYLLSLRIDPTDADAHYNLAILYDDHMGESRRAARHYRSYLKLAPNADDVDQVKNWLVAIEMQ